MMKKPEIPATEPVRMRALCALNILDTPPEERFDRITRIARRHFQVSIALVSLVDKERQWFKSRQGLDAAETPRDISFCGHAILSEHIFYIPNALHDPRFADNPLVTGAPNIRFYAGAPLHSPEGERIGTLCIIDDKPRQFSPEELSVLRDLADGVESELERTHLLQDADDLGRFKHALDSTLDMIFMFDSKTLQFNYLNEGAVRSMGYSKHELLQMHPYDINPEIPQDKFLQRIAPLLAGQVPSLNFETVHRRKDGQDFPVAITLQLVQAADGLSQFVAIVHDISARLIAEKAVTLLLERLSIATRAGGIGIWDWDIVKNQLAWDDRMFELYGVKRDAFGGAYDAWRAGVHADDRARCDQAIQRALQHEAPYDIEFRVCWPDSTLHDIKTQGEVTWNERGEPIRMTGVNYDITERKKIERMKSEFISTVSHELRTPLTSIRGALGLVLGKAAGQLPDKVQGLLEIAERNSERLTILINDILDLEKIEAGRLEFNFKIINLIALTRRSLEDNDGYAQKHQVRLVLDTPLEQATVRADEQRLLQVLANLISNAVKYSSAGGEVRVSVTVQHGGFQVSVRDNGAGIPAAFRQQIFQRFAQADSSDTRVKGGTGLGLSIAKAIIEQHAGSIGYHSELGVGTLFHINLQAHVMAEAVARTHKIGDLRVLICENNRDVAQILADMIEPEGVVCDITGSASEARILLTRNNYRLLLLDLSLPDMDGRVFLQALRELPATAELPVIVISERAHEQRAALGKIAVNVMEWIQKPVDRQQLARALRDVLYPVRRPQILHVEADLDIAQVVRVLLEDMANLTQVDSLRAARHVLSDKSFDLVLLDPGLEDSEGVDLLGTLKGQCPVIVFSAQSPRHEIAEQASAILIKSVTSTEQLLQTIKKTLNLGETK